MQFYQVSSDWIYSPMLNRIENRYGLAGIGFYWKVVCATFLAGHALPEFHLLTLKGKGLKWGEAQEILREYPLFVKSAEGNLKIVKDLKESGVITPQGNFPELTDIFGSPARTHEPTQAPTPEHRPEGMPAPTLTPTPPGSAPVLVDSKENIRLEESVVAEQAAEEAFEIFLQNECPHLYSFEEPITFDELKELRELYSIEDIRSVLVDMNDRPGLSQTSRSCAKTARRWLEARERKRERRGI